MLIRLKKYLNPHEISCSKVISILITGNILHESSSALKQHKSVQYKWFALYITPRCFAYRHAATTTLYQLQRGFEGRRQHARIQDFCQFYLVLSLFYSLQSGSNGFIAEKTILILYQGSRGGPLFSRGGGVSNLFSRGIQMLISIETQIRTCIFQGDVQTPYPPLDLHMGNFIITGQYLSQSRF